MANFTISPNMSLPIPTVGVDPGPDYANNQNQAFVILDGHTHTPGNGIPITPAGLNINSDLSFQNQNATTLRSLRFSPQLTPLSLATDLGALYESGVDLYFNDGNGNQVRITQSGGIAGSPGSIANLVSPATASYVAANQTFVWQSAANTPANLDAASVILRNLSANSKGVTLNAPASLASNYALQMPTIPASQSFVTLDASGNLAAPAVFPLTGQNIASQTVTASNIASGTITTTQIASQTITGGNIASQTVTASNIANGTITANQISGTANITPLQLDSIDGGFTAGGSAGGTSITSTSATQVTSVSLSSYAANRPVSLSFTAGSFSTNGTPGSVILQAIGTQHVYSLFTLTIPANVNWPISSLNFTGMVPGIPDSYTTYKLSASTSNSQTGQINFTGFNVQVSQV